MAARGQHPAAVRARNALLALIVGVIAWSGAVPASAHNVWKGGYRRWPWRAGETRTLTTLPGQCPHCPGTQSSSAWKAIDAAMRYENVHAISPGVIDRWVPSGGAAGKYLRIKDDDGTYITYEHLSKALVTSGRVVAGQPIAVSGCTGNCSGPHLHFQRHDAPSFWSNAKPLVPISGHGSPTTDPLTTSAYTSDNAGIGHNAKGGTSSKMQAVYRKAGGYKVVGAPSNIGDAWSPCRADSIKGTWWRYYCRFRSGVSGGVQTFRTVNEKSQAIMQRGDHVHLVRPSLLAAYTAIYDGHEWGYWMGYPTSDPMAVTKGYKQRFEFGVAYVYPSYCRQDLYSHGYGKYRSYHYCD